MSQTNFISTYGSESIPLLDIFYYTNSNFNRDAGAIVLKIGYGYTIEPHAQDPLVDLADKAMEDFSYALLPATWAVEFLPISK